MKKAKIPQKRIIAMLKMLLLQMQKNYVNILITKGFANMIEHKYLKLDEVIAMLNVSRNWFYKMRKAGKFVKPAIERPMRWRLDQINNFLDGAE
jgi:predicted DNA-binding transcriptional regulator AlpA